MTMTDSRTRLLGSLALVLTLGAACSDRGAGAGAGEGEGEPAIAVSDPAVLSTYESWEASCIRWLRGGCSKSDQCDLPLSSDCDDDDETLRVTCNEMVADEDNPCAEPDPLSFDECLSRDREQTCSEYCDDAQFCFNFCFFRCLD